MADAKIGGNEKINKRIIMFDEMTMAQMMAGFPNLLGIPYQMIPVFMVSEMDQLTLIPYIDAIESYGLPSDTCPLPTAECGCAVKDEYPMCGQGFIASSMPCDGSVMATSFQDRRFSKFMPSYPLCMPVRYDDEDTTEMAAADMKDCIHWVEGLTGETWNLGHLLRHHGEDERVHQTRDGEVGDQQDPLSAAGRFLLRAVP